MKFFQKISLLLLFALSLCTINLYGQRYASRNGTVKLSYNAPHGKMETINRQVNVGLNVETGEFRLTMVMLSFRFHSAYNQEKFNEYFIKNAHFANSTFRGKIEDLHKVDFSRKGEYEVQVTGDLTLRQTTNKVSAKGKFIVGDDTFSGKSVFMVNLMDFNFNIPPTMEKLIEVTFDVDLKKL
jgi:polyisoprenoid-binding protein YceI